MGRRLRNKCLGYRSIAVACCLASKFSAIPAPIDRGRGQKTIDVVKQRGKAWLNHRARRTRDHQQPFAAQLGKPERSIIQKPADANQCVTAAKIRCATPA